MHLKYGLDTKLFSDLTHKIYLGHDFIVKRDHALTFGTMSGPGQFTENGTNIVNFREIPLHVLKKLCEYMYVFRLQGKPYFFDDI